MDYETDVAGKSKKMVVLLVLMGFVVLGIGAVVAFVKRSGGGDDAGEGGTSPALTRWCQLRTEWANKVRTIESDILLKSVKKDDEAEKKKLEKKRNELAQQYARKVKSLVSGSTTEPRISKVELALVKEGKARANTAVRVYNLGAKLSAEELSIDDARAGRSKLDELDKYVDTTKAQTGREIERALGGFKCPGLYRGPFTDRGTSDNPYTSWAELKLRIAQLKKRFDQRIAALEPMEQFANQVYHKLVRKYRDGLKQCFKRARRADSGFAEKLGLRVRLKSNGKVKGLAIEWVEVGGKRSVPNPNTDRGAGKLLDCLLRKASKWKLPQPIKSGDKVVVKVDFASL